MGGNSYSPFCLPSEKRSTLKGKNLLHLGANSHLFRVDFLYRNANKKSPKLRPVKNGGNSTWSMHSPEEQVELCVYNVFLHTRL